MIKYMASYSDNVVNHGAVDPIWTVLYDTPEGALKGRRNWEAKVGAKSNPTIYVYLLQDGIPMWCVGRYD